MLPTQVSNFTITLPGFGFKSQFDLLKKALNYSGKRVLFHANKKGGEFALSLLTCVTQSTQLPLLTKLSTQMVINYTLAPVGN